MNNTTLTCTICGAHNVIPIANGSSQAWENMTIFCQTCSRVTLHQMSDAWKHVDGAGNSTEKISTSTLNGGDAVDLVPLLNVNDFLWRLLQDRLASNGVNMDEFLRCDLGTKARLITAVGFNGNDSLLLLKLAETKNQHKISGVGIEHLQLPEEKVGEGTSLESPRQTGRNGDGTIKTPQHKIHDNKWLHGFSIQENGTVTARCSVYPHLPAEFWCSLCGVMVSSRCHVTGIHKDHPFITLRQAAEAHICDLNSWLERCRSQLNVASTIMANLHHGREILHTSISQQKKELDRHFEEIVQGLSMWRDELKKNVELQVGSQLRTINTAMDDTSTFIDHYTELQRFCDPLLSSIPPMNQTGKSSEDWSIRVMSLVSQLKNASRDPIPMPNLFVPEVKSLATATTYMELLRLVDIPAGPRLPDVFDTGFLNFPYPSDVGRVTFTLQPPTDGKERGILIYSGRTLTREQDITPAHALVCASQIFFSGIAAWEVHVDRLGTGPGRILAGVLMAGTEGEGVVWDGLRIVGPNEGECLVLHDRYKFQIGTTLRFVLELEAPLYFLTCYYEEEFVARIPLPPTLRGWIPAVSVFGPSDQVTVVPIASSVTEQLRSTAVRESNSEEVEGTKVRLVEQEYKINSLQQQMLSLNARLNHEQNEKMINQLKNQNNTPKRNDEDVVSSEQIQYLSSPSFLQGMSLYKSGEKQETVQMLSETARGKANTQAKEYSPELQSLLHYIESIK